MNRNHGNLIRSAENFCSAHMETSPGADLPSLTRCQRGPYFHELYYDPAAGPILGAIRDLIKELSVEDIGVAAAKIRVSTCLWDKPRRELRPSPLFYSCIFQSCYVYGHCIRPPARKLSVMFEKGFGDRSHTKSLLAFYDGAWRPLRTWLVHLPDRESLLGTAQQRLLSQRIWWENNGKKFPLMSLPPELRRVLYRHIIGIPVRPVRVFANMPRIARKMNHNDDYVDFVCLYDGGQNTFPITGCGPRSTPRLLTYDTCGILCLDGSTGQKIREEALFSIWEGTLKYFCDVDEVISVATSLPPHHPKNPYWKWHNAPKQLNWLSRIELHLSVAQFFRLFGVTFVPGSKQFVHHTDPQHQKHLLSSIDTCKELRLRFRNPEEFKEESPWIQWLRSSGSRVVTSTTKTIGCSRIAVDWILTAAFPFIKHIPTVRLIGCIKTSIKNKWDHILATEYLHRNEDGWVSDYDWHQEMSAIVNHSATPKHPCLCPFSCVSPPYELNQFDHDDVYTPDMGKRAELFLILNGRWPTLFGPDADDLSRCTEERMKPFFQEIKFDCFDKWVDENGDTPSQVD